MKALILLCVGLFLALCVDASNIGVNYGRVGNNLLPPSEAIILMKDKGFGRFKIFDASAEVLKAAEKSGLKVSVMVKDKEIPLLASHQLYADSWVYQNIVPFKYRQVEIEWLFVGNEIFYAEASLWGKLVPAMKRLQKSLRKYGMTDIKLTTPIASNVLAVSYPTSASVFRQDMAHIMDSLLKFLTATGSPYSVNVYPYIAYAGSAAGEISLKYALGLEGAVTVEDGEYDYTNLFDAMVDSHVVAMQKMGYKDIPIMITETGWPTSGGNQASAKNAKLYNNQLIKRMLSNSGTPRLGKVPITTFLFSLTDENKKSGQETERHWGVCYSNGISAYKLYIEKRHYKVPEYMVNASASSTMSLNWLLLLLSVVLCFC